MITTPIKPKLAEEIHSRDEKRQLQNIASEAVHYEPGEEIFPGCYALYKVARGTVGAIYAVLHTRNKNKKNLVQMTKVLNAILPFASRHHNIGLLDRQKGRLGLSLSEIGNNATPIGKITEIEEELKEEQQDTLPAFNNKEVEEAWRYTIPEKERQNKCPYEILALKLVTPIRHPKTQQIIQIDSKVVNAVEKEFLLSSITHDNIVGTVGDFIYDFKGEGLLGPSYGFLMEYVDGPSLSDILKKTSKWWRKKGELVLPPGVTLSIINQISHAFKCLQRSRIQYQDLQKTNILIGINGVPKITDFGMVEETAENQEFLERIGGDLKYHAPEIVTELKPEDGYGYSYDSGKAPINSKSIVYSLGGLAVDLARGEHPFKGDDSADIMENILEAKVRDITKDNPHYSKEDRRLIIESTIKKDLKARITLNKLIENTQKQINERPGDNEPVEILATFMSQFDEYRHRGFKYAPGQEAPQEVSLGFDDEEDD